MGSSTLAGRAFGLGPVLAVQGQLGEVAGDIGRALGIGQRAGDGQGLEIQLLRLVEVAGVS